MCMGMRMRMDEENYQQLPDKLIFYVLSYLPLSSLFKFRSVCKLWNTLFLHPHLAFLHYRNSQSGLNLDDLSGTLKERERLWKDIQNGRRDAVEFNIITTSSQGLYLQEFTSIHDSSIKRYRIECSILHQRLDIPNPQNPSLRITLDFVLDSQAVKLVSVHQHGYEILSLGIGSDQTTYGWRDVKLPNLYHEKNKRRNEIQVFFRMGVAYCIWHIDDCTDIEIDVLDMVNETYIGRTSLSKGFLFTSTSLMDWNGQLSFVRQVKDELHVLVLNDYRKLKWDETTRIIKLSFLNLKSDNKELMTFITFANNSLLFFVKPDKKTFCAYNINTGELTTSVLKNCITSSEDVMDVIVMMMFCGGGGEVFYS
uniref:F-box domain-containing protein n=1 Tax=Solanum tuberosum TaxID=4113 RepID=M1DCM3_SOLTU